MNEKEMGALDYIARTADPEALRQVAINAHGKSETVVQAALRRLTSVSSKHPSGTVEHECWAMVNAVEELRRLNGRKVSRMHRMRPKIVKDGEIAALEYCAVNETAGFAEIIGYGLPELTAEAIVLKYPQHFSQTALANARARLEREGIRLEERKSSTDTIAVENAFGSN